MNSIPNPAGFHVMIVDDDESVRMMLVDLFQNKGFRVSACENGPVAMRVAKDDLPDLVMLDYHMPDMDGLEVCRNLRQTFTGLDTPIIIMMTGQVADEHKSVEMQRGFDVGANDYFSKPFELEHLLCRVRAWLRLRSTQKYLSGQVTQRELELTREHDYNQALLATMADALLVIDAQGIIRTCNQRAGQLLEYAASDLQGMPLQELLADVPPQQGDDQEIPLANILARDTRDFDTVLRTATNARVPVSISSAQLRVGASPSVEVVLVARDIRERKRLQQEQRNYALKLEAEVEGRTRKIRDTEARYQALFESIGQPLMVSDLNGVITDCNSAYETFTQATREQLLGRTACEVMCERHDCPEYHEIMERARLMDSFQHECLSLAKTGEQRPITIIASIIGGGSDPAEEHSPHGMLWIIIDRTEHEEMEAKAARTREYARHMLERMGSSRHMVGKSRKFQQVLQFVSSAATTTAPVLILGQSGTGKEVTARAIHNAGPRKDKPFVILDCAAIQGTLLESELFGHHKGAFSGASEHKPGIVEIADNGTLFVDEIGEMPGELQSKLLRILERGEFRRLGSVQNRKVDLRVISATNRDLTAEVRRKTFRQDLFFRLNVLTITLPSLRERKEDIPLLARHCLDHSTVTMGSRKKIRNDAMELLQAHDWPGNVRELRNVIERAIILSEPAKFITAAHLPAEFRKKSTTGSMSKVQPITSLDQAEADCIARALEATAGKQTRAAELLGISRMTLWRKMQKHGLTK